MGEAIYKEHTPFRDETAGGEIWKKRSSAIKEAGEPMKAAKERIKNAGIIHDTAEEGLPGLFQSNLLNVLKLPPEKLPEPIDYIITQEDGSILNTQTGEVTAKSESMFKPSNADPDSTEKEIERLRLEQQKKNLPQWMKQN